VLRVGDRTDPANPAFATEYHYVALWAWCNIKVNLALILNSVIRHYVMKAYGRVEV
jgi:hypothetical protein